MDKTDNQAKSVIKLKNLYFENISFKRDKNQPRRVETGFATEFNNITEHEVEVKLKCIIKSVEFELEIVLTGEFENTEEDSALREELNRTNTIAIMFPYMRAEVSLITAQPNFPTIDLPIININAFLNNGETITGIKKND